MALKGTLRRIAIALTTLLLSFALLSSATRAKTRYFYCEAMGLMETDPCAAAAQADGAEHAAPTPEARPTHTDCCEIVTVSRLPAGTRIAAQDVPPPAPTALLPAGSLLATRLADPCAQPDRSSLRWRVPSRYPGELRTQLMVFLT